MLMSAFFPFAFLLLFLSHAFSFSLKAKDDLERTFEIVCPPQRIVSLVPTTTKVSMNRTESF